MKIPYSRTIKNWIMERQIKQDKYLEGWKFSNDRIKMIYNEILDWKINYLWYPLKDKIVLDVGAGEGETAKLFLEHGAKMVVCIECDPKCFKNLYINAQNHRGRMIVVPYPFSLKMLQKNQDQYGFMKMDIEGFEIDLLKIDMHIPSTIELHGLEKIKPFIDKGYTVEFKSSLRKCISYAFWGRYC